MFVGIRKRKLLVNELYFPVIVSRKNKFKLNISLVVSATQNSVRKERILNNCTHNVAGIMHNVVHNVELNVS